MKLSVGISLLFAMVSLASCAEIYDESLSMSDVYCTIDVSEREVVFEFDEASGFSHGTQTVHVTAENLSWSFVDLPDWIKLRPKMGTGNAEVTIVADIYSGSSDRTGRFKLVSSDGPVSHGITIAVVQHGSGR